MSDTPENVPSDDYGAELDMQLPKHLDMVAIQLHEMYTSLCNAGFTKKEARELVGYAISAGIMEPYFGDFHVRVSVEDEDGFEDDDFEDGDPV